MVLIILLTLSFKCTGFREVEKKDNLGRITHITYYDGTAIKRDEEIKYYGNSHNPAQIIYKKRAGLDLITYKEELYYFESNNLVKLSFYINKDNKKINTGLIKYFYRKNNKLDRIEYYSYIEQINDMFIFCLDQYTYKDDLLISRRFIEYEINPDTKEPMQTSHYVITYKDDQINSIKLSLMDKKSKKIVEKNEKNIDLVNEMIETLEDMYNRKTRGSEFLKN